MIYKDIAGMKVSSLVFGGDTMGSGTDEKTAFMLFDKAMELGCNTIDTARSYGCFDGGKVGDSERTIGKWLRERGGRDKIILSTKCAHPISGQMDINRLSKAEIVSDVDASLKDLETDYIDILWLHRDDVRLPVEPIMDTLDELVKSGKVRAVGTSNWTAKRIALANEYAKNAGKTAISASQIKWSAASSSPDFEDDPTLVEMDEAEYEFYKKTKMPVFAFASQAKGFFQKYHKGGEAALSEKARARYLCEGNIERYHKLLEICDKYDITLSAAIVASLTSNKDFDTVAIVGCKTVEQVVDTFSGADVVIEEKMGVML